MTTPTLLRTTKLSRSPEATAAVKNGVSQQV